MRTDEARGIKIGELVISFRSTEFIDDSARDAEATNNLEIKAHGWAFGQIADMQDWYASLKSSGKIPSGRQIAVTGYSLGGHLATAFNLLHKNDLTASGTPLVSATYTFNGAGVGDVNAGKNLGQVIADFQSHRAYDSNEGLFTDAQVKVLYNTLHQTFRAGALVTLSQVDSFMPQVQTMVTSKLGTAKTEAVLLFQALGNIQKIVNEAQRVVGLQSGGTGAGAAAVSTSTSSSSSISRFLAKLPLFVVLFSLPWLATAASAADPYVPVKWTKFVKVEGQSEPVPEQWLQDAEARLAYSLKLPDTVPKPVPFDFKAAYWRSWVPGKPKVAVQYFNHLCSTEAGEWIFRKEQNVEGLYFARPQSEPTTDVMTDPYGPEMPWIQRIFMVSGNGLQDQGGQFVNPPFYNYRFVEQPRRAVDWQKGINDPYVRLFGFTTERARDQNGSLTDHFKQTTPMQVVGIPTLTARYGYTWRGIKRPQDRENGIAGGEVLIYDMQTKEVLAVRRQFLIAGRNPRGEGKAMWEVAASCPQVRAYPYAGEFKQFAFDILQTIEPSKSGK